MSMCCPRLICYLTLCSQWCSVVCWCSVSDLVYLISRPAQGIIRLIHQGWAHKAMFGTVMTCLLLASVIVPVVEGNCTVVVNGAQGMSGLEGPPGPPGVKGDPGPQAGGAVYTRWGRTVCGKGVTLIYAGRAPGTKYNVKGGTSDTPCMPARNTTVPLHRHWSYTCISLPYGTNCSRTTLSWFSWSGANIWATMLHNC